VFDVEYTAELGEDGFAEPCTDAERPLVMILREYLGY